MKIERSIGSLFTAVVLVSAAEAQPTGIYQLDDKLSFNVLDGATLNRTSGQVTLIGHFDPKFRGKIPYLQHLATLLESPAPTFSLEWTPESDAAVKALLRRMDSMEEMRSLAREWGRWFDDEGNVTSTGRYFLTTLGIQPRGGSWEGMDRFGKVETVFRAAGNNKAADTISAYGRFQTAVQGNDDTQSMAAFVGLFLAAGKISEYQSIYSQARQGQITEPQGEDRMFRLIGESMDDGLLMTGSPFTTAYDNARARGIDPRSAFDTVLIPAMNSGIKTSLTSSMNSLFDRLDEVQVPNEILAPLLRVQPEVVPEFRGLDAHSQLARVLFESDYLGKTLVNKPELRNKIPGYETEFGFQRRNFAGPESSAEAGVRIWITVDRVDLSVSPDGDSLLTQGAKMRFNLRKKSDSGTEYADAYGDAYANLLTSLYDQLAIEFGILHELSECAKVVAVARWLKEKEPDLALPQTGRVAWDAPGKVPGLLFVQWTPKRPRPGAPAVAMEAMGGISLVIPLPGLQAPGTYVPPGTPVDSSVVDLRSATVPQLYDQRLVNHPGVIATGAPQAIAWITEMAQGQQMEEAVSFVPKSLNRQPLIVPQLSGPYGNYAMVLWNQTEALRSKSAIQDALARVDPNSHDAAALHMCLGQVCLQTGDMEKANQEFTAGVKLMPNDVHVLSAQARELVEQGKLSDAAEVARQIVAQYPQNHPAAAALQRLSSFPPGGVLPADAGLTSNPSPTARAAVHNALEQLEVIAQVIPNLAPVKEVSAEQARLGFDREASGQPHGVGVPPVGPSGPVSAVAILKSFIPDQVMGNDEIKKALEDYTRLDAQRINAQNKFMEIKSQQNANSASPAAPNPELTTLANQIQQIASDQNQVKEKIKKIVTIDLHLDWQEASPPSLPSPGGTGAAGQKTSTTSGAPGKPPGSNP